jgi:large subunit ribosomal protein L4
MNYPVYNQKGEKVSEVVLPPSVFDVKWNNDLVAQVVHSLLTSRRKGTAHTKDRGEVRGGGKKPWRQKGTGRARHGSTRSPIWVGGGVAHGPRNEKNFERKANKKMRQKALAMVLSQKVKDDELLFVNDLSLQEIKTKTASNIIKDVLVGALGNMPKNKNACLLCVPKKNELIEKSFRNLSNVATQTVSDVDVIRLLNYKYLVVVTPDESLKILEKRLSFKN